MRKLTASRRLFLGGAAVAIALPFFESLTPREARGAGTAAPKRFMACFMPNGFDMADFRPTSASGTPLALGPMMASLADFKDHLLVLGSLQNTKQDHPLGDHSGGIGSMLTNHTVIYDTEKMGGPSIDQVVAKQIGGTTKLPSLELAGEPGATEGSCDSGYRCSVGNHIAFDSTGTPLPKLYDTGQIFDRLFQGFDPGASQADIARRNEYQKSILDSVLAQATELKAKLNAADNVKLDEYLSAVRQVETRIEVSTGGSCMPPMKTTGQLSDQQRAEVLNDLVALAFQCDITRVATLMWGNVTSNRNYAAIGAAGGHHDISHHGGNPDNIAKLKKIGKWEMDRLAYLLAKLKALPDSDGRTVLDNTLILYSSDISDGDAHNHDDMPVLLAGGGADFTMNRYVDYKDKPHFGDLFISIANAFGDASVTTFGEHGTKPLDGLKV
ncbi:MAG TPA: DUF1552 domain-containing protein [Polyangiaceae bacterium]|nr:DUF1552 domain-containing protein [Polyangiaceae bacterium]